MKTPNRDRYLHDNVLLSLLWVNVYIYYEKQQQNTGNLTFQLQYLFIETNVTVYTVIPQLSGQFNIMSVKQ